MKCLAKALRVLFLASAVVHATTEDLTKYVNPLIGSEGPIPNSIVNSGDVFPGPSLPFGVVKLGPDTTEFNPITDAFAGYTPDGNGLLLICFFLKIIINMYTTVTAFTMLHESGIGGAPKYGVVPQMPLTTLEGVNVLDNLTYMQPRAVKDFASVGYYRSHLQNGVQVELSASRHSGILQYNFPSSGDKPVLVDVSHHLPSSAQAEPLKSQTYSNGQLVVSEKGAHYTGGGVSGRVDGMEVRLVLERIVLDHY
jgi:putative alpha-1,2-mannosidase